MEDPDTRLCRDGATCSTEDGICASELLASTGEDGEDGGGGGGGGTFEEPPPPDQPPVMILRGSSTVTAGSTSVPLHSLPNINTCCIPQQTWIFA